MDAGGIGGQARSSSLIRNYLGFGRGVSGSRLAEQAYEQASSFGASFVFMHRVDRARRSGDSFRLSLSDGRSVVARAVILATGASYRRLGIPSLEELNGRGRLLRRPHLGGSGADRKGRVRGGRRKLRRPGCAAPRALRRARHARGASFVARPGDVALPRPAVEAAPNVEVRTGTTVVGGGGEGHLQQLVLREGNGDDDSVPADALFVLIGARPQTDWLPPEIARDEYGFLLTGDDIPAEDWPLERRPLSLETSMPGVLASGDVRHALGQAGGRRGRRGLRRGAARAPARRRGPRAAGSGGADGANRLSASPVAAELHLLGANSRAGRVGAACWPPLLHRWSAAVQTLVDGVDQLPIRRVPAQLPEHEPAEAGRPGQQGLGPEDERVVQCPEDSG